LGHNILASSAEALISGLGENMALLLVKVKSVSWGCAKCHSAESSFQIKEDLKLVTRESKQTIQKLR